MSAEQQPEAAAQPLSMPPATERQATPPGMPETESAIATLLMKAGYLTPEQFAYARKVRSKLATPATLLQVLQELHFITPDQLRQALRTNHVAVRLGDLLVELGLLRTADLQAALAIQKGTQSGYAPDGVKTFQPQKSPKGKSLHQHRKPTTVSSQVSEL